MHTLKNVSHELAETKSKLDLLKCTESELKSAQTQLAQKDVELNNVINLLQQERTCKEELIISKQTELEAYEKRYTELEREKETLIKDMETIKKSITDDQSNTDGKILVAEGVLLREESYYRGLFVIPEIIRSKVEHEKLILLREQDQDRDAYQKLLSERNILEARVESLEKELTAPGHHRSLSDVSTISAQDNSRGSPDGRASIGVLEVMLNIVVCEGIGAGVRIRHVFCFIL